MNTTLFYFTLLKCEIKDSLSLKHDLMTLMLMFPIVKLENSQN